MKVSIVTTYTCEYCGNRSDNQEDIKDCEKSHKQIEIIQASVSIEPRYSEGIAAPTKLIVKWVDGEQADYFRRL